MIYLKTGIIIGGVLSLLLVIFHISFYKIFEWKRDFARISTLNAKIYMTVHIALILFLAMFATISFLYTDELARATGIAGILVGGYALIWLWRLIWQIIYFKPNKQRTQDSKRFMHYILIFIFFLLFAIYIAPLLVRFSYVLE